MTEHPAAPTTPETPVSLPEIRERLEGVVRDWLAEVVPASDWTKDESGRVNSSPLFESLAEEVGRLIRQDAHILLRGDTDSTGRLIMAQLAHKYGLSPARSTPAEAPECVCMNTGCRCRAGKPCGMCAGGDHYQARSTPAEAALGTAPRAEGLDVERLLAAWVKHMKHFHPDDEYDDPTYECAEHAAAEYARLSRPSDERVPESEEPR